MDPDQLTHPAGVSLAQAAQDHWDAQGPFGKGKARCEMEVSTGEQRESQLPGPGKQWLGAAEVCVQPEPAQGQQALLGFSLQQPPQDTCTSVTWVLAPPPQRDTAQQDNPEDGRCGLRISQ